MDEDGIIDAAVEATPAQPLVVIPNIIGSTLHKLSVKVSNNGEYYVTEPTNRENFYIEVAPAFSITGLKAEVYLHTYHSREVTKAYVNKYKDVTMLDGQSIPKNAMIPVGTIIYTAPHRVADIDDPASLATQAVAVAQAMQLMAQFAPVAPVAAPAPVVALPSNVVA